MRKLFRILRSKLLSPIFPELNQIKFLIGQNSILSSRSMHNSFENLWDAEVKVYSQWGEDGILDFLCEKLYISKPKILEIGAGNFNECNSYFLAKNRNASVVAVDIAKDLLTSINSSPLKWTNHLFGIEKLVSPNNINELIDEANNKMDGLDIVSFDIDGNDYWVVAAADLKLTKIVIVEYNPIFGSEMAVTVPRDDNFDRAMKHSSGLYFGASLKAFIHVLANKGFVFIGSNRVGNNAFFIPNESIGKISLSIPKDLNIYTDWRIRESRDSSGKLSYLSLSERVEIINDLPLIEVMSGNKLYVKNLFNFN